MNLTEKTSEELQQLAEQIRIELKSRVKIENVLVKCADIADCEETESPHYNGGWFKTVIGLDQTKTNGYSILGDFIGSGGNSREGPSGSAMLPIGTLVLDCSIGGSRNNQYKSYFLMRVKGENDFEQLEETEGNDWATDLWDVIKQNL